MSARPHRFLSVKLILPPKPNLASAVISTGTAFATQSTSYGLLSGMSPGLAASVPFLTRPPLSCTKTKNFNSLLVSPSVAIPKLYSAGWPSVAPLGLPIGLLSLPVASMVSNIAESSLLSDAQIPSSFYAFSD